MFKCEFGGQEDVIDKINSKIEKLEIAFRNYETERRSIAIKLNNGFISTGKRGKLHFRLDDINQRLIPELHNRISRIQPPAII